jgi:hypothetical protein
VAFVTGVYRRKFCYVHTDNPYRKRDTIIERQERQVAITIKSAAEIAVMRQAGAVLVSILKTVSRDTNPGITTSQLEEIAVKELAKYGTTQSFKGYKGFPAALCVSINDEVVHGISGDRVIQEDNNLCPRGEGRPFVPPAKLGDGQAHFDKGSIGLC